MNLLLRNAYYQGLIAAKRELAGIKPELIPRHMSQEEVVLYNIGLSDGRKQYGAVQK